MADTIAARLERLECAVLEIVAALGVLPSATFTWGADTAIAELRADDAIGEEPPEGGEDTEMGTISKPDIDNLYVARAAIDEVLHVVDPAPPASDGNLIEDMLELCRTNPQMAAEVLVNYRKHNRVSMRTQLPKILDLNEEQRRKLDVWLDSRTAPEGLDIFEAAKTGDPKDGSES